MRKYKLITPNRCVLDRLLEKRVYCRIWDFNLSTRHYECVFELSETVLLDIIYPEKTEHYDPMLSIISYDDDLLVHQG